jgi:hypothetical protein
MGDPALGEVAAGLREFGIRVRQVPPGFVAGVVNLFESTTPEGAADPIAMLLKATSRRSNVQHEETYLLLRRALQHSQTSPSYPSPTKEAIQAAIYFEMGKMLNFFKDLRRLATLFEEIELFERLLVDTTYHRRAHGDIIIAKLKSSLALRWCDRPELRVRGRAQVQEMLRRHATGPYGPNVVGQIIERLEEAGEFEEARALGERYGRKR